MCSCSYSCSKGRGIFEICSHPVNLTFFEMYRLMLRKHKILDMLHVVSTVVNLNLYSQTIDCYDGDNELLLALE